VISLFFLSMFVGFSGAVVPGPLFAYAVGQALTFGWMAGLWLSLGHVLAEVLLVLGLRAGLGDFLQRPKTIRVIGLLGGLVLLYFAWSMLTMPTMAVTATRGVAISSGLFGLIWKGMLLTLVNPYFYLWWATIGLGMITTQAAKHGPRTWEVFLCGHGLSDVLWYGAISILLAVSGSFLRPSVHHAIIMTAGIGVAIVGMIFILRFSGVIPNKLRHALGH
jgi:threonine/homoserine/homoserine lactone efflux protein